MKREHLAMLYEESFRSNWNLPAFSDYQGINYSYGQAAEMIAKIQTFFVESGVKEGDKIAIFGRNSSNWAITFISCISYGAVAVPILPDFNSEDIHHILEHSESTYLFAADQLYEKLSFNKMPGIKGVVSLINFNTIQFKEKEDEKAWKKVWETEEKELNAENFALKKLQSEEVCVISYTSGTSGFSKGVMIPVRSIFSNILYAQDHMPLKAGDRIVSFLPMAHVFGLLFEFLFPVTLGCHITFLTKAPTPQIITKAFQEIKPNLILSVPLVIEKIYRKRILPTLEKPLMRFLLKVPILNSLLHKKVKEKLVETFGGEFFEIVIGGAALNKDVEDFFRKIKFPFTIGYGMTECGPLISYDAWHTTQPLSAGKLVERMEVQIDSEDPYNNVGEILVRGENVMLGYYKNKQATDESIDTDGWLHTGDLGVIDKENYIYIKGRSKNMLLGPSGQNIYPEEIEAKVNNLPYVQECVVVERDKKLVALVYPEKEMLVEQNINEKKLGEIINSNRKTVNNDLPKYAQISKFVLVDEEFEKTPKKSIKRYLYT